MKVRPAGGASIAAMNASLPRWWRLLALLSTLLVLSLPAVPGHAAEEDVPVNVGRTLLRLPVPAGFVDAARPLPPMRLLGERMTPPSNRLLAIFISDEDLARAQGGQPPQMARYFMAQTLRQAEESAITEAEFQGVRQLLRQQYQSLLTQIASQAQGHLDNAVRDIGRDAGVDGLSLKMGELKGLEIFDDQAMSISLLAATKYAVQVGDQTQEIPMAMGITTATLRGKLVYFYAYAVYRNAADLDWVRQSTRAWLPRAQASNPP